MDTVLSSQTKRAGIVVLAVALVALAGCAGGGGTDTATPTANGTVDGNDTTTPTTNGTDLSDLASDHAAQINAAESLTVGQQSALQQERNGSTTATRNSQSVLFLDLNEQVGRQTGTLVSQSPRGVVERSTGVYTAGNETFVRSNTSQSDVQYFYAQEPYNSTEISPIDFANGTQRAFYDNVSGTVQSEGTTEFEGTSVQEYTTDEQATALQLLGIDSSAVEVDNASATFLVTDSGLITSMSAEASGTSTTGVSFTVALQQTVSDVDATTVQEPDWLSEVEQSS